MLCFPSSRQTQWDPPTWDSPGDDASLEHEAEMDLGTPTYDENPMKVRRQIFGIGHGMGGGRGTEVTPDPLEWLHWPHSGLGCSSHSWSGHQTS